MSRFSKKFYRDKINGKFLGVCAGMGEYFAIDPLWFRLGFVIILFFTNILIVFVYFIIAIVTKGKPPYLYVESLENVFSDKPSSPTPARRKDSEK